MNDSAVMTRPENQSLTTLGEYSLSLESVKKQVNLIQEIMNSVMIEGEHYGKIPGCGDKNVLLKAGAEKIAMTFRFSPKFLTTITEMKDGHREYQIVTELYHIITGAFLGQGVGSCSTMETKYRYRKAEQICPECGQETIIKGKKEYGGGWLCYQKKGGCGAKFKDGDPAIENQNMGRIEYDNPVDYYNTVYKMAKKRSLIDAILTATAASDIFTQDIDDSPELYGGKAVNESKKEPDKKNADPIDNTRKASETKVPEPKQNKPDDGLPF